MKHDFNIHKSLKYCPSVIPIEKILINIKYCHISLIAMTNNYYFCE